MVFHSSSPVSLRFRRFHVREILSRFDLTRGPLDLYISLAFRKNPQLGSKDRAYISETVYAYFRMKNLLDYLYQQHEKTLGANCQEYWTYVLDLLDAPDEITAALQNTAIPHHIRLCLPTDLYNVLENSWGKEIEPLALALNKPAPLTIRTNVSKISPEVLVEKLQARGLQVEQDTDIKEAIHFSKRVNLFSLPEFTEGYFEVQDKGSQMIARLVEALPKQHILDFCSGSGGKTLAIAPSMKGEGQIYLHDIRDDALVQAKKRLNRAGIQNAQWITASEGKKLSRLKGKMDWVLVDAPCSGTGTLRRNPDMKWKFSLEMLERVLHEQKEILRTAVSFLKPQGRLVYATCSLLRQENEEIVESMSKELDLELDDTKNVAFPSVLKTAPHTGVWDGFFAARLKKRGSKT